MDSAGLTEWIGLLRCCTAFEAYCQVYTADLKPDRIAEFLLFNSEFPHSVRFAVDAIERSLEALHRDAAARRASRVARLAGRLRAELSFTPLDEVIGNLPAFLRSIERQCMQIHEAVYQTYIMYPIETALGA
jgi:uncharacterized alpha-E superfamily protein